MKQIGNGMPKNKSTTEPGRNSGSPVRNQDGETMTESIFEAYNNGDVELDGIFDDAIEIPSAGLDLTMFKDEKLDSLIGIPFVVVGGTFRERIVEGKFSDFVTLIAIVASAERLEKRRVRVLGTEPWWPGQTFGINDGSTGIRRQIVAHLHNTGIVEVVKPGIEIVESGKRGECTFDCRLSEWETFYPDKGIQTTKKDKETGEELMEWEFSLPKGLVANRGIRSSEYKGRFNKMVTTRYLA